MGKSLAKILCMMMLAAVAAAGVSCSRPVSYEKFVSVEDREANGLYSFSIDLSDSLCTYDFETGKQTVLQEEIDFSQIELCGGRLLCKRSARVGKDQLFFLNQADMSEEVLYETPNKIPVLYCSTNPDFLLVQG